MLSSGEYQRVRRVGGETCTVSSVYPCLCHDEVLFVIYICICTSYPPVYNRSLSINLNKPLEIKSVLTFSLEIKKRGVGGFVT